ncbi:hypothetical protein [Hymenobacter persicinus]|uniref:Uncharacterized protein n=1 Tax=Hymenobacter persicinus TaxID=2025506 RepID=A0A4Q5LBA5_9BACT|nr:hypothetical protein [Hymenobacter persicinus]RYU79135.1 hypothetical protein EWM57_11420 [Hymenobacter persicinus]
MPDQPTSQSPLDQQTEDQRRNQEFQPDGRQAPGDHSTGANADDNSGSGGTVGGTAIKGKNVAHGTTYDAPGNAAEGDVGGSTTSSGTGVSGGETGQVPL